MQNVVAIATDYQPDITIFDTLFLSVIDLLEQIGQQQIIHDLLFGRFLVITNTPDERTLFELMRWGASAYVHTWHEKEDLINIVKGVSLAQWQLSYECLIYPLPQYVPAISPEPAPATLEKDEIACHFHPTDGKKGVISTILCIQENTLFPLDEQVASLLNAKVDYSVELQEEGMGIVYENINEDASASLVADLGTTLWNDSNTINICLSRIDQKRHT